MTPRFQRFTLLVLLIQPSVSLLIGQEKKEEANEITESVSSLTDEAKKLAKKLKKNRADLRKANDLISAKEKELRDAKEKEEAKAITDATDALRKAKEDAARLVEKGQKLSSMKDLTEKAAGPIEDIDFLHRARFSFTAGQTLSKSGGDFSRKDTYFAFTADFNLQEAEEPHGCWNPLFMGFEFRLTPVPQDPGAASVPMPGLNAPSGPSTDLLSEKKTGYLALNLYSPFARRACSFGRSDFESFAGWLIHVGGQVVPDTPGGGSGSGFSSFQAVGARLALMEGGRPSFGGPRWGAYMDVLVGRWNNFEHTSRFVLETRIQIPKTPLIFGFDANMPLNGQGQANMRALLAIRVQVEDFFKALGFKTGS